MSNQSTTINEMLLLSSKMEFGGKIYNGVPVGHSINPNLVISAFANEIDNEKIERYSAIMKEQMLSHDFPPIMGYPIIIGEEDLGDYFMNGEEVTEEFLGKRAWKVTDGHHRVFSAIEANLPMIEVELDYSTVTNLKEYYKDGGSIINKKNIPDFYIDEKKNKVFVRNVLHGTCKPFKKFDKEKKGSTTSNDVMSNLGFNFTPSLKKGLEQFAGRQKMMDIQDANAYKKCEEEGLEDGTREFDDCVGEERYNIDLDCRAILVDLVGTKIYKADESQIVIDVLRLAHKNNLFKIENGDSVDKANYKKIIDDDFDWQYHPNLLSAINGFSFKKYNSKTNKDEAVLDVKEACDLYIKKLKLEGYDIIQYKNEIEVDNKFEYDFIVFDEKQIKYKYKIYDRSNYIGQESVEIFKYKNGGIHAIPLPIYKEGQVLDLKGYGKVKILSVAWLTPPMTVRPQYIYDFILNPNSKITKNKRNDFSLYESEVEMMLSDYDTGIDYNKSYDKYLAAGITKTGTPPLSYIKFIEIINRSLYYKNNPEISLDKNKEKFYDSYAVLNGSLSFENGGSVDYSGKYSDLYQFINDNDLQQKFVEKYSKNDEALNIETWEDYVRGEMGSDDEVIKEMIGKDYKLFYNEEDDEFIINKKKTKNIDFKIILSNDKYDKKVISVIQDSGIYSEYKPRFVVLVKDKVVGGSTFKIDEDNVYHFDLGIKEEYQGYGVSKELIDKIVEDAKNLKAVEVSAYVVNNMLFQYLKSNNWNVDSSDGEKYAWKKIKGGKFDLGGAVSELKSKKINKELSYEEIINSESFLSWFGNWKLAYETAGLDFKNPIWKNVSKAVDNEGKPLKMYHGITHEWTTYSRKLGNHENDMGIGFYATSDRLDAHQNYLSEGKDLQTRIAIESENIVNREGTTMAKAKRIAEKKLKGKTERIIEVFLKIKKPLIIDAVKNFDATFFDFAPNFDEDNDEYTEPKDLVKFKDAFDDVCEDFDISYQGRERIWSGIMEKIEMDYISAFDLIAEIKRTEELLDYAYDNVDGVNTTYEFISQIFQKMGFDGVIYVDASNHFKGMDIGRGTKHIIAFKPKQIKLADGTNISFDSKKSDIRFDDGGELKSDSQVFEDEDTGILTDDGKMIKIGGVYATGMGYSYRDLPYIKIKDKVSNEEFDVIDYIALGEKYFFTHKGEPTYYGGSFELYDSKEEAENSKEYKFYNPKGYVITKEPVYNIMFHRFVGDGIDKTVELENEFYAPESYLKTRFEEYVAENIIGGNGVQLEGENFKSLIYYKTELKYSFVVADEERESVYVRSNLTKEESEQMKNDFKFYTVKGTQLQGKTVGRTVERNIEEIFDDGGSINVPDYNTEKNKLVLIEATTKSGLQFDFDVNESLNIDEIIRVAKDKAYPQELQSFTHKGIKYKIA